MSDLRDSRDDAAPPAPPRGALLAIFLIVLCDMLGFGIIIPLLPFYADEYQSSPLAVGLLFSIFSVCQLVGAPVLGVLSDRFGRRPILILSQIGSALGYFLLAIASYVDWANPLHGLILIYISRAIDGISGGNISTAQAYISDITTKENRSKGMGVLGAAFGIGFSLGPAMGGILGHYHIALPALAAAILCMIAAAQTYLYLVEARRHEPSEDEVWLHPASFKPILADSSLMHMLMIGFFSMMAFVMLEATFALFLNFTFGWGKLGVGLIFAYIGVVIAVVQGRLIGPASKRFGDWNLAIVGPVLVAVALLIYTQSAYTPLVALIFAGGLLNATGRSLQTPALSALISHTTRPELQGATFGLYHMLLSLSRTIGPMLATWAYAHHHIAPFLIAAGITLACAIWTVWLKTHVSERNHR